MCSDSYYVSVQSSETYQDDPMFLFCTKTFIQEQFSGFGFVLITIKKMDGSWLVLLQEISGLCHREVSHG